MIQYIKYKDKKYPIRWDARCYTVACGETGIEEIDDLFNNTEGQEQMFYAALRSGHQLARKKWDIQIEKFDVDTGETINKVLEQEDMKYFIEEIPDQYETTLKKFNRECLRLEIAAIEAELKDLKEEQKSDDKSDKKEVKKKV